MVSNYRKFNKFIYSFLDCKFLNFLNLLGYSRYSRNFQKCLRPTTRDLFIPKQAQME